MSQNDLVIANQSFPSFRTDLNSALQAINTSQSGTSRPSGAVAGTIWLDTTSATTPTLKYYDGADDISLATLDHSANTVNWLDSTVSVTGLTTTATGTVLTLSDTATTSTVNLIIDNDKEIRFREATANGTNYVSLSAPASLSADLTFTLPATDGTAGQFLSTNGSGVLSFATVGGSATPFAVIGNATAGSEIRLPEDTDNGSNYVAIKAPDTIASNLTLTLPSADGTSGQVLQTNGSGVLSFAGVSASAGQVIQVITATDSTERLTSSTSFVTASNTLSVTITPSSASNKILVIAGTSVRVQASTTGAWTIFRDATDLGAGSSAGMMNIHDDEGDDTAETAFFAGSILDSPATTSSTTYQVYMRRVTGVNGVNLNYLATKGSITVMEIKG
jgi:hypothetical protein